MFTKLLQIVALWTVLASTQHDSWYAFWRFCLMFWRVEEIVLTLVYSFMYNLTLLGLCFNKSAIKFKSHDLAQLFCE